jgi:hypothetical protein
MTGAKRPILGVAAFSAAILGAQVYAFPARADDTDIVSGAYDDMLIGFDPATRVVTGYFFSQTVRGQFSCIFYLKGVLHGPSAHVSTYFPETPAADLIKGELALETHMKFRVKLPSEHGGCWNVEHFADDNQPAEFTLKGHHPWTSVAVVRSDKAYFFDAPASVTHRKAYLVKGDGVGVRASQPGWLEVDFIGGHRPVSGWIRQSDIYPAN